MNFSLGFESNWKTRFSGSLDELSTKNCLSTTHTYIYIYLRIFYLFEHSVYSVIYLTFDLSIQLWNNQSINGRAFDSMNSKWKSMTDWLRFSSSLSRLASPLLLLRLAFHVFFVGVVTNGSNCQHPILSNWYLINFHLKSIGAGNGSKAEFDFSFEKPDLLYLAPFPLQITWSVHLSLSQNPYA